MSNPRGFQPQERAAARDAGLKQYFTGRPCVHGHIAYRCVANGMCNECQSIKHKKYVSAKLQANPEFYKQQYASNPEYYKKQAAKYRQRNPESVREAVRKSNVKRKPQRAAAQMIRHASKLNATPPWLSKEQRLWIESYYQAAQSHKQTHGIVLAVDHIVPLRGKDVCGLHVPWNLCLMTKEENTRKFNKLTEAAYWPKQTAVLVSKSALPWNLRKEKHHAMEN